MSSSSKNIAGTAALCIASGNCPGAPTAVMSKLRDDARNKSEPTETPYYGFTGDPNSSPTAPYYGYAGGY